MQPENAPCPKKVFENGKCVKCTDYPAPKGKVPYCKKPKTSLFGFPKNKK